MGKRGVGFYWKLAFTNLKGNRRVYLPYLLSSVGIIMMFYSINALGQGIDQGALYGGTTVASMMGLGVFVIGLFAVLFLFYTNSFIIKRRKKELGLYNILGMEKRHIAHILFRETLLIAVCSLALGWGWGLSSPGSYSGCWAFCWARIWPWPLSSLCPPSPARWVCLGLSSC